MLVGFQCKTKLETASSVTVGSSDEHFEEQNCLEHKENPDRMLEVIRSFST